MKLFSIRNTLRNELFVLDNQVQCKIGAQLCLHTLLQFLPITGEVLPDPFSRSCFLTNDGLLSSNKVAGTGKDDFTEETDSKNFASRLCLPEIDRRKITYTYSLSHKMPFSTFYGKKSRLKSTFLPYHVKKHHSTLEMDTFKIMLLLSYLASLAR